MEIQCFGGKFSAQFVAMFISDVLRSRQDLLGLVGSFAWFRSLLPCSSRVTSPRHPNVENDISKVKLRRWDDYSGVYFCLDVILLNAIGSMCEIVAYIYIRFIYHRFMVHVGSYSTHGAFGN